MISTSDIVILALASVGGVAAIGVALQAFSRVPEADRLAQVLKAQPEKLWQDEIGRRIRFAAALVLIAITLLLVGFLDVVQGAAPVSLFLTMGLPAFLAGLGTLNLYRCAAALEYGWDGQGEGLIGRAVLRQIAQAHERLAASAQLKDEQAG